MLKTLRSAITLNAPEKIFCGSAALIIWTWNEGECQIFTPKFTITNRMTSAITRIERARGFLDAAQLSADWVREVGEQVLILEAHHTTHIEGTRLTLDQAERLWKGEAVPEADPDDAREPFFASKFVLYIPASCESQPPIPYRNRFFPAWETPQTVA